MNANPFQPIEINWTGLSPTTADELSSGWAQKISRTLVRGAGFGGSAVVPLQQISAFTLPTGVVRQYFAQASFSLPNNAYGSKCPPMIYPSVQYGSRIYYKRLEDVLGRFSQFGAAVKGQPNIPSEFVTWIEGLHYEEISTGTFRWSFSVVHRYIHGSDMRPLEMSLQGEAPQFFKGPLLRMKTSHWPDISILNEKPSENKVALYYYSLGMDPSLV